MDDILIDTALQAEVLKHEVNLLWRWCAYLTAAILAELFLIAWVVIAL